MANEPTKIGPNVKRLIAHKASLDAVPPGGGLEDAVEFLVTGKFAEGMKAASDWVRQAIQVIKSAPGNPHGDDDEAIAGELLRRIEERKTTRK